jgi:4-hydroxybenzoate polyprenyltransferase
MRGMRVPWGAGIVGHVGLTLKSLNIPSECILTLHESPHHYTLSFVISDAYEDSRFDKEADKRTGFHTKSILTGMSYLCCSLFAYLRSNYVAYYGGYWWHLIVPVVDQLGAGVAVIQAVNKRSGGGAFLSDDVRALESLAAR